MRMKLIVGLLIVSTLVLGWVLYLDEDLDLAASSLSEPEAEAELLQSAEGGVQSYLLANGMKILVIENDRAPVMVSQIWYKVGASYEHDGITGISHVVEHMLFKGTEKYPDGEFSKIIAASGGEENAFTGQDFTAYFQKISNDKLEMCIEMEADRMRNIIFDEVEFKKEMAVVKEERRLRTDDKPTALTYEHFSAVAFTNSPYRRPIVGWMEDLENLTMEDARQWYDKWYAPNNATLVVAGDVDAEEVFRLAKQYFGPIPRAEVPQLKPRHETKQLGTRRLTVELPAKIPFLIMGYKVPILTSEIIGTEQEQELYALEVLAGVLDGGSSARFSKNLVRGQEIAVSASAGYSMSARHESLFVISAVPNDGVAIEVLEFALREQLNIIKTQLPDEKELDRVKAQVAAAQVFKQDSTFYQAMEVGMLETIGLPWSIKDDYVRKIMAVTAEQVQQVANKYLRDERLTVAVLEPLPITANKDNQDKAAATAGEKDAQ